MIVKQPALQGDGASAISPEEVMIEMVDETPEGVAVMTDDGGAVVSLGDEEEAVEEDFYANLAEHMSEDDLRSISSELLEMYDADKRSRSDWEKTYEQGLDLLGLKFEDRTEPWDGACGVFHPLLTDSVVRFQAQTMQEVFPASGPAKTTIAGSDTLEKTKQAKRVQEYINHVTTKVMVEYRDETEKLLFSLPIAGSAFRKIYFDPTLGRSCSMFVPAEDVIVSYGASHISTAPRVTHLLKKDRNELRKLQVSGFYRDIDLNDPSPDLSGIKRKQDTLTGVSGSAEFDTRYTFLEMQVEYNLPGFEDTRISEESGEEEPTGIGLPYVMTFDKSSGDVLSIRRNWKEENPEKNKREHFVHYMYLPGMGFYGFGLVHMIGGLSKSATMLLRQLIDAGTLSNLPGGLKSRGLRIKGDDSPIMPGEFRDVDVIGGNIKDNITFLPYKEPSGVLYQLLKDLVDEGRRFASAADMKAADMNAEAPVGTTLAILEREMKVLSAIQARIHAAMGKELSILSDVIKDFGPEDYPYEIEGEYSLREDFDERVDVLPVSDPNAGTMAQRIMRWQAVLQLSASRPDIYDEKVLHRKMLEVLDIEDAEDIIPTDDDLQPADPVTEFMNMLTGKPVKAFMYQDHEAHIQAHMSAAQNPQLMKMMEGNPQAQAIMATGAAHIAEHLAFLYRQKIEQELGSPLPSPDEPMPEDIELRISRLVAPAAAQLTGKAQQQQQAEENAKKQEDPIIQMEQKKLEQKDKEIADKAAAAQQKVQTDLLKEFERIKLQREKMQQDGTLKGFEILAGLHSDHLKAEGEESKLISSEEMKGYEMGLKIAMDMMKGRNTQ